MVSVRNSSTAVKSSNGFLTVAPNGVVEENGESRKKYKKKKKRRRQQQQQRSHVCVFFTALLILLVWRWARQHLDWRHDQAKLQRLKRAYSLQRFREAEGEGPPKMKTHEMRSIQHVAKQKKQQFSSKQVSEIDRLTEELNRDIVENRHGGIRWINPTLLPSLPGHETNRVVESHPENWRHQDRDQGKAMFKVNRRHSVFPWESTTVETKPPRVDYTTHHYTYPDMLLEPPKSGGYPPLMTLGELYDRWPQDAIDEVPTPFEEQLQRFDYSDPQQLEAARRFRDFELPFKVYNVPELDAANLKWTDEYLSAQFDSHFTSPLNLLRGVGGQSPPPHSSGMCQESHDNFFAFFIPKAWEVNTMGLPPTRNNDFTFERWAKHARYADSVGLGFDQPHFYWQSGVPKEERQLDPSKWTFVSRDLPSWSSREENFFLFSPENQKGIQCRFGERGVTAATHYDAGRNMVAMVTGAKRYVLSPPNQCSKLGIINIRGQPAFRHSLLNFAHINHLKDEEGNNMSQQEREWLERASTSLALDTVLKAGEVLYIPSHWFHYITSLQKSAQCNVRSGREMEGTPEFGGYADVDKCDAP